MNPKQTDDNALVQSKGTRTIYINSIRIILKYMANICFLEMEIFCSGVHACVNSANAITNFGHLFSLRLHRHRLHMHELLKKKRLVLYYLISFKFFIIQLKRSNGTKQLQCI
jgi:hypothetical protein